MSNVPGSEGVSVGTRWPELLVAGFLFVLSVLVVTDSIRVGTGWADDGPRSGYFPFYIGILLMGSSGYTMVRQLICWKSENPEFAQRGQLSLVVSVLIPIAVYVVGIWLAGIYLASLVLIAYFMLRYGKYGLLATAGVSVGVPLFFFLVFERWFLVPLPKGPIERLLGF
jgi:putative tricarboxylic transport membrane protein